MAQNLTNIGQGGALAQHLARQCMPELMRTLPRRIDAGPRESVPDDRQHRYRALEATNRCFCAQKYKSAGAGGAANSQVSGDCFANVGRQRQCRAMTTLAAHVQAASFPINIFQRKAGDFASPQTEPRKQQQYCVIPAAHSALTVAACQNSPHVIRLN
jgi:hypothetical protein